MATALLIGISKGWGWSGIRPKAVIAENLFGNMIVADQTGRFWRICPEELTCELIAEQQSALDVLFSSDEFQTDWQMSNLVARAHEQFGSPPSGNCYCLKLPAVLGGSYTTDNFAVVDRLELIITSGNMAEEIKELPDGGQVEIQIMD